MGGKKSEKAGQRFANTERFKSSEKCADHDQDNDLAKRLPIGRKEKNEKMSGRMFVHSSAFVSECVCECVLFVFCSCAHFSGCFYSKHVTVT